LGIVALAACADGNSATSHDADIGVRASDALPIDGGFYRTYGVSRADELVERRTATSYTFRRADGSLVSVIGAAPLNHRTAGGDLRPIDRAIVAVDPAASSPVVDFAPAWANVDNSLRAWWSPDARDGVVIAADGVELRWTPGTLGGDGIAAQAPGHGVTTVAGAALVVSGSYPGIDERWTVGRGQLKHDVVLSQPPAVAGDGWLVVDGTLAPVSPGDALELQVDGVRRDGAFHTSGAIDLVARASGARLRLDVPFAHERDRHEQQVAAEYRVEPLSGGGVRVAVAVPLAWLRDPGRRYPVVIDPTVSLGTITGTVPVYLDNQTVEDCATGQLVRGGQTSFFRIGLVDNPGQPSQGFWCYRGAFKFSTAAIPDNATVARVDLNASSGGGGSPSTHAPMRSP